MKYPGHCHEKGWADRDKWGCPKVHMVKGQWVCDYKESCSTTKKGRTTYTYADMDFSMFSGIQRDTEEWKSLYKIRSIVKRAINNFKINMCVAGCRTRNHATTKADVLLAGIASQFTVIVSYQPYELSTIHQKPKTLNCLKKHLIVILKFIRIMTSALWPFLWITIHRNEKII